MGVVASVELIASFGLTDFVAVTAVVDIEVA
jgi:hypothetical protein